MARAQAQTEARADEVLTLQVGLAQWAADLDALVQLPQTTALDWNGRVLRLTRRGTASATDGVLVVGWTRRVVKGAGTWLRWQSPPVTTRGELEQAWQKADIWSQNPGDEEKRREVADHAAGGVADLLFPRQRLDQSAVQRRQQAARPAPRRRPRPATGSRDGRDARWRAAGADLAAGPGDQRHAHARLGAAHRRGQASHDASAGNAAPRC